MAVGLQLPHNSCNLECKYCYQASLRHTASGPQEFDLDAILESVKVSGEYVELAGGEALLLPKRQLEKIFKVSYQNKGKAQLQTNGVLIDSDHIKMFERYNVRVGVSVDGPGELNDLRSAGDINSTRENTKKSIKNIKKLANSSVPVDVISMFSKCNIGSPERRRRYKEFLLWLDKIGVDSGEMMFLRCLAHQPGVWEEAMVPEQDLPNALVDLARFFDKHPSLIRFPFNEVKKVLRGENEGVNCFWKNCDPWRGSRMVYIDETGRFSRRICWFGRPAGFNPLVSENEIYSRTVNLYYTSREQGGCRGCEYFSVCMGHCANSALNGDSRNRSIYCSALKKLFSYYEKQLLEEGIRPLTQHPKRKKIEEKLIENFKENNNSSLETVRAEIGC